MGQCAHLKNYATVTDCEVVAIAELRPELAKRVASRYGVPRVYRDHEMMLAAERLDGIVAVQQFTRHGLLVPELLKVGVPVFIEKPLAGSIEVGEKIVQAVNKSGTWLMVGYHKRSDPATMYVKAEVDRLKRSGELGRMRYVRILMPPGDWIQNGFADLIKSDESVHLEYDPPASDMDEETYKEYLSFMNYYVHQINLLRHLFGESYHVEYAEPSGVLLVARSQNNVTGVIEMSPYSTTLDWQETALVCFERGWIKIRLPAPLAYNRPGKVEIFRDPGGGVTPQTVIPQLPWIHAMRQQSMNFVKAIKGEMKPMCEAEEALEDLEVAREYMELLKKAR
ncbi:Gfo/Idh/MocA family oxidoreductase [Candidatus Bathyarchaeota archaeon]|nr:Gfo/Idh/MocA family oxidoreductase [Candidatus Bathyarchaeota archaeon]